MNTNKKILRYCQRVWLEKIITGSALLFASICCFFTGILPLVGEGISLVVMLYSILRVLLSRTEPADEMAVQNMNRAKAFASDALSFVLCLVVMASILFLRQAPDTPALRRLIPAVAFLSLGSNNLLTGLAFRKLEEM